MRLLQSIYQLHCKKETKELTGDEAKDILNSLRASGVYHNTDIEAEVYALLGKKRLMISALKNLVGTMPEIIVESFPLQEDLENRPAFEAYRNNPDFIALFKKVEKGRYYTVKKNDTLRDIAGAELCDPLLWRRIWKRNRFIKNPNLIYPGQKLVLPLNAY